MNNCNQLKLFNPGLPEWKNITIEWLYDYLTSLYPEMNFQYGEGVDEGEKIVKQTAYKKVKLDFGLGIYAESVDWVKNRNFISCHSEQEFGHWSGMGETYDNMEDFIKLLPLRIQHCKDSANEYKNRKTDVN